MFPHIQKQLESLNSQGLVPFISLNSCLGQVGNTASDTNRLSIAEPNTNSLTFIPKLRLDSNIGHMVDDVTGVYYTLDRNYIGTRPVVAFLKALKICPELAVPAHLVCSVGYSEKLCAWVAWNLTGVECFSERQQAVDWIYSTSNLDIDRYCSLDKLFASAVVTSRVFLNCLEQCEKETISNENHVQDYSEEAVNDIIKTAEENAHDTGVFNEMFGDLLSLYRQKDPKPSDLVQVRKQPASPLFARISGEHRQHKVNMPVMPINDRRQSGAHYQHNVPTDSAPTAPHVGIKVGIKKSGEHIQHGLPNPPTYYSSQSSDLESVSVEDPSKYEWYRYSPANGRGINLKGYNKDFPQASIDDTEVFGVKPIRGKDEYYLTFANAEDFGILFRVPSSIVDRAVKVSKTYKGKVPMGRAAKPVEPKETKPKITKIVPKTEKLLTPKERRELERERLREEAKNKKLQPQVRNQVIQPDGKINLSDIDSENVKARDVTYLGMYQQSMFSDDYHILIDDERDDIYSELMDAIARNKNSNPVAYIFKVRTSQDWVAPYIGTTANRMRMSSAIVKRILATNKHETINGVKNIENFSQKPTLPKASKFKRSEPIYYGNSFAVLSELKSAILEGYFTKAFKVTDIKNRKAVTISDELAKADPHFGIESVGDEDYMLVLSAQISNPLYDHEADEIGARIARVYGPALRTTIKKSTTASNDDMTFVIVRMALKKSSDEHLHRSRALHDLVRNFKSNRNQIGKTSDFEDQLTRYQNEYTRLKKKAEVDVSSDPLYVKENEEGGKKIAEMRQKIEETEKRIKVAHPHIARRLMVEKERLEAELEAFRDSEKTRKREAKKSFEEEANLFREKIEKFAREHESEFKKQLVFNTPVYKAKFGSTLVSVEVIDYNIPDGTIGVRVVRGGDRTVHQVKNLYSFFDETKVFP